MSGTFVQDFSELVGQKGVTKIIIDPIIAETLEGKDLMIVARGCDDPTTQPPTTTTPAPTTVSTTTDFCTYLIYVFQTVCSSY